MAEKLLEMRNISKRFGGVLALDSVDFEIERGEIHCLVGENGSGKSTLIKIISGIHSPDPGGEIYVDGRRISHQKSSNSVREGIQVIYQDLSLFPNLLQDIQDDQFCTFGWYSIRWLFHGCIGISFHSPIDPLHPESRFLLHQS